MLDVIGAVKNNPSFTSRVGELKFAMRDYIQESYPKDAEGFSPNVWRKIDRFLDLGSTRSLYTGNLSEKELEQFLDILAKLLKKGIVGYKYYEVNGKIEKHFIVPSIAEPRLDNAKLIRRNGIYI